MMVMMMMMMMMMMMKSSTNMEFIHCSLVLEKSERVQPLHEDSVHLAVNTLKTIWWFPEMGVPLNPLF